MNSKSIQDSEKFTSIVNRDVISYRVMKCYLLTSATSLKALSAFERYTLTPYTPSDMYTSSYDEKSDTEREKHECKTHHTISECYGK